MIWFLAIAAAVPIGIAVRLTAHLHNTILEIQQKYQETFFELADEIVDRDDVTSEQLAQLSGLSADMRSRKTQFIVFGAIQRTAKSQSKPVIPQFKRSMNAEMHALWNKMYFRWLFAVTTQGSILGLGGLSKLLAYFGPDEPTTFTDNLPYISHAKAAGVH